MAGMHSLSPRPDVRLPQTGLDKHMWGDVAGTQMAAHPMSTDMSIWPSVR